MTEIQKAMLGDREAQERVTERGELLPCPMCHSDEISIQGDGYNIFDPDTLGYVDSVEDTFLYATCGNCGTATAPAIIEDDEEFEDTEKRVAAIWNTRPVLITPEQIKILEELE